MTGEGDVVVIRLDEPWSTCAACGEETPARWGLPVADGEVVENDYVGDWGGVPACRACFEIHAAGGVRGLGLYLAMRRHYLYGDRQPGDPPPRGILSD